MENEPINLYKKDKYKFPGQRHNEEIILVLRKHKITLLPYTLQIILLSLLPIIFYNFIAPLAFPAFLEAPYKMIFIFLSLIYFGFIWILIFIIWVDYYLDIWIVTDRRMLDVEQIGFFHRVVSELDLKRIQDITSRVNGILATMFGFGNIRIQTAAEEHRFELKSIPHPVATRRKIVELCANAKENDRFIFRNRDEN